MSAPGAPYGAEYYNVGFGPAYERNDLWLKMFGVIADRIVQLLHPASVFDAGCAWGFLVEALYDRGVEAHGRDISAYAIGKVREDLRERCALGSLSDPITGGPYGLITCFEVLEHMPEQAALGVIAHFAAATDAVLFSSAPDEFIEPTHINVHPVSYWLRVFREHGFSPDVSFDASFIAPHAFLVRRCAEPVPEDIVALFTDTLQLRVQQANRQVRLGALEAENTRLRLAVKALEWRDPARPAAARVNSLLSGVTGKMALRYSERYREWRNRNIERQPWIKKYWEPSAVWLLGRFRRRATARRSAGLPAPAEPRVEAEAVGEHDYQDWIRENEPGTDELEIQRRMSECFSYRPRISVLMPVYRIPLPILRDALDSVAVQTYQHWELCIAVTREDSPETLRYLEQKASQDPRFRVAIEPANEGISANSNRALSLASGEYLALLDHDDVLAPFALFEVVQLLNQTRADFIYSDRDQLSEDGTRRLLPLFKPEWSPEVMLNANYVTQLSVMRTEHVRACGGWRRETDGAQDWDLFFRVIARSSIVSHIPKVLYHWRQVKTSVAGGGMAAKPYAAAAQVRAVEAYLKTLVPAAGVVRTGEGCWIQWPAPAEQRVSVIYVSPSGDALPQVEKLANQTSHPNFEIVCASPRKPYGTRNVRVFEAPPESTLLQRIEMAVQSATGSVLVFIDEAVEPGQPDWLVELAGPLAIPGVGVTGARLLDAQTGLLRHCGLVIAKSGRVESVYSGQPKNVNGPAGLAAWYRNWTAVSGACFAMRREVWDALGGFGGEPAHARPDVAFCLRLRGTSWRIAYNPFAWLFQSGEAALETPLADCGAPEDLSVSFSGGDPHFNVNLDCQDGRVILDSPHRQLAPAEREPEELVELLSTLDTEMETEQERSVGARSVPRRLERLMWFLPARLDSDLRTILRFADGFQRCHGVASLFCTVGAMVEPVLESQVASAFPELAARSRFFTLRGLHGIEDLPAADAAVCTSWVTAYAARRCRNAGSIFYFLQDDEALSYPAGSTRALAEATYRFGYYGICNSVSLLNAYTARGGHGSYFTPCVDRAVFHAGSRRDAGPPPGIVFVHAHPGQPRTCFELVCAALRIVKRRKGDAMTAIAAGGAWNPRDYGMQGVLHNWGVLGRESLAALYRACDAGVVLSVTRHPSHVPLELMACGALVIGNRNPDTAWLLQDRENCLLADLSAPDLARTIEEGLENGALRQRLIERAAELVQSHYSQWDGEIDKIYQSMLSAI